MMVPSFHHLHHLLLLLLSLCASWSGVAAQSIFHDGALYANNSLINIDDIGEDSLAIHCQTTLSPCCKEGSARGEWFYPNSTAVHLRSQETGFYRNRDDNGNVKLNRRNDAQDPRGTFVCIIPNGRGENVRLTVSIQSPLDYPEVSSHPADQLNIDPGTSVTFSVRARRAILYQWYHNDSIIASDSSRLTGTRDQDLTIMNVQLSDQGVYSCVVSTRFFSAISDEATLTLLAPPRLLMNPEDALGIRLGSNISFTVVASGERLQYLWQRADETLLTHDDRFVGVATDTLTIQDVWLGDEGQYVCVVSNAAGSLRSEGALLTLVGVEEVSSLTITTAITSARLTWPAPETTNLSILSYEVQYYPVAWPLHRVTINTTSTSHQAVGLIPHLRYEFRVRVYTSLGHGEWVSDSVLLNDSVPVVTRLQASLFSSSNTLLLTWLPPSPLPGWNVSYYYVTYKARSSNSNEGDRPERSFQRPVDGDYTFLELGVAELLVREGVVHEFEVQAVLKVEGLEGIAEVKGERAAVNLTLDNEELPFQVVIGPVQYCIEWEAERARKIEQTLQRAVTAAISARCDCDIPGNTVGSGVFSCRTASDTVAYRSTVAGLNATELIGHVEAWVSSSPTLTMDWYLVDVYADCPVGIATLGEPDCQLT